MPRDSSRLRPRRSCGLLALVVAVVAGPVVLAEPAPPGAAAAGGTFPVVSTWDGVSWVTVVGEPGHRETFGVASLSSTTETTIRAGSSLSSEAGIEVETYRDGEGPVDTILLEPPRGESLVEGTYAATHDRDSEGAHLSLDQGCATDGSTFTVHDIEPDLSRLWVTFLAVCEDGPAVSGEIRLGAPAAGALEVAPARMGLPPEPVGELSRMTPVTVMNTSGAPVVVSDVSVVGDDAPAFDVAYTSCGRVAAGGHCHAWVQFAPRSVGPHRADLSVSTSAGCRLVALSADGAAAGGVGPVPAADAAPGASGRAVAGSGAGGATVVDGLTTWRHRAGSDSTAFDDRVLRLGAQDLRWSRGSDGFVSAYFSNPSVFLHFSVDPGEDDRLFPGTRLRARPGPHSTAEPRMSFGIAGLGCASERSSGSFTVHEAHYALSGRIDRLAVSFRHRCRGDLDDVRGALTIDARALPDLPRVRVHPTAARLRMDRVGAEPYVSFAGRVVAQGGRPLEDQVAQLQRRRANGTWTGSGLYLLDAQGRFAGRFRDTGYGGGKPQFRTVWPGTESYPAAVSPPVRTPPRVRPSRDAAR